jgi:hypothetical protein
MRERKPKTAESALAGWLVVFLICLALLGWGLINYATIRDAPRRFDLGAVPDAPGESEYSLSPPPPRQPARQPQMAPLPEAIGPRQSTPGAGQAATRPGNMFSAERAAVPPSAAVPSTAATRPGGRP